MDRISTECSFLYLKPTHSYDLAKLSHNYEDINVIQLQLNEQFKDTVWYMNIYNESDTFIGTIRRLFEEEPRRKDDAPCSHEVALMKSLGDSTTEAIIDDVVAYIYETINNFGGH